MDSAEQSKIAFHPEAMKRCEELARDIQTHIQDFGPLEQLAPPSGLHPAIVIKPADIRRSRTSA